MLFVQQLHAQEMLVGCAKPYFGFSKFEQNLKKAVHYYELAALQGCPDAQEALGRIYYHGTEGVSANYDLAVKYWEQASDQGKANAQSSLGTMYARGLGVSRDDYLMFNWG